MSIEHYSDNEFGLLGLKLETELSISNHLPCLSTHFCISHHVVITFPQTQNQCNFELDPT